VRHHRAAPPDRPARRSSIHGVGGQPRRSASVDGVCCCGPKDEAQLAVHRLEGTARPATRDRRTTRPPLSPSRQAAVTRRTSARELLDLGVQPRHHVTPGSAASASAPRSPPRRAERRDVHAVRFDRLSGPTTHLQSLSPAICSAKAVRVPRRSKPIERQHFPLRLSRIPGSGTRDGTSRSAAPAAANRSTVRSSTRARSGRSHCAVLENHHHRRRHAIPSSCRIILYRLSFFRGGLRFRAAGGAPRPDDHEIGDRANLRLEWCGRAIRPLASRHLAAGRSVAGDPIGGRACLRRKQRAVPGGRASRNSAGGDAGSAWSRFLQCRVLPICRRPLRPRPARPGPSPALARAQRRSTGRFPLFAPTSGSSPTAQRSNRARDDAWTQHLPRPSTVPPAMPLTSTAPRSRTRRDRRQPARARGDDNRAGSARLLKRASSWAFTGRTDCCCCRSFAEQIADYHQPGGDPDVTLGADGPSSMRADSVDHPSPARTSRSASSSCARW